MTQLRLFNPATENLGEAPAAPLARPLRPAAPGRGAASGFVGPEIAFPAFGECAERLQVGFGHPFVFAGPCLKQSTGIDLPVRDVELRTID
jgi:hypothetical protein